MEPMDLIKNPLYWREVASAELAVVYNIEDLNADNSSGDAADNEWSWDDDSDAADKQTNNKSSAKDRVVLSFTSNKDRAIGKKTIKKSKLNPNGGMVERSVSVHVSNVNPVAADKTE